MSLSILRTFALARPVIAAYLPALAHGLHVFARTGSSEDWSYVKVGRRDATVALLKGAVIGQLQLGVPPSRVRLLREVDGGGAPVPLDDLEKLAGQGVGEGTRVVVEVMRAYAGLLCLFSVLPCTHPPPLSVFSTLMLNPCSTTHFTTCCQHWLVFDHL
jgi:hypothetical protein